MRVTPERPSRALDQKRSIPMPMGETTPRPVMTTRRFTTRAGEAERLEVLESSSPFYANRPGQSTSGRRRRANLGRPEQLRRLGDVARRYPQDRPVASAPGAHGIDGRHVDLRVRELGVHVGDHADAVLTADQERALGPGELPLG